MLTRHTLALGVTAILLLCGGCSDPDGYPGGGRLELLPGALVRGELDAADASDATPDLPRPGADENVQDEPAVRAALVADGETNGP
jgi:hypothetical protein